MFLFPKKKQIIYFSHNPWQSYKFLKSFLCSFNRRSNVYNPTSVSSQNTLWCSWPWRSSWSDARAEREQCVIPEGCTSQDAPLSEGVSKARQTPSLSPQRLDDSSPPSSSSFSSLLLSLSSLFYSSTLSAVLSTAVFLDQSVCCQRTNR